MTPGVVQPISNNQFETFGKDLIRGTNIDIFSSFDTELNAGKYFLHLYNELCFTYSVFANIDVESILKQLEIKFSLTSVNFILRDEQARTKKFDKIDYSTSSYFILLKDKLLIELYPYKTVFWYGRDIEFAEIAEILKMIETARRKRSHKRKFYMVAASSRAEYGFELKKFNIKKVEVNIQQNYNDDFEKIDNLIINFLKEDNRNGLLLLHGKHGTGKTTYIRHILSQINRPFIFLPLNLMEAISAPNFLPFISNYKNSILVLEDCEDLLAPRGSGNYSSNSLVNLLNLGDGLLSDALSFKIICTFNANLKQIDQAILRKGRLIARYEFKELDVPKVQAVFDKLGIQETADKTLTLAEIYNKNEIDFSEMNPSKKVGFV